MLYSSHTHKKRDNKKGFIYKVFLVLVCYIHYYIVKYQTSTERSGGLAFIKERGKNTMMSVGPCVITSLCCRDPVTLRNCRLQCQHAVMSRGALQQRATNQESVFRSRDLCGPIRTGHYCSQCTLNEREKWTK